jgi:tetratricopeptide (TPR) repeat protein
VNTKRLLLGLIGLTLGFIVSFIWTRDYNKNNAVAVGASGGQSAGGRSGSNSQEATMAQIRETMDKAKRNPNDFEAQIEAAGAYDQIGRAKEAVDHLKKAIEINPADRRSFAISAYVGNYYLQEKDFMEAEKWFRRAAEINPAVPDAYVEIAATYLERQPPSPDKAIQELQRALKIDSKNPHALEHLVEAHTLKKDARSADDALARLKEAEPGNKRLVLLQGMVSDLKAGKPVTIPKE